MVEGDKKFLKFLSSIKITDTSLFNMEFIHINKSNFDENLFIYTIKNLSPWTYKEYITLINGLKNLKSYNVEFKFLNDFKINNDSLINFIKDCYFDTFKKEKNFDISFLNNDINLLFSDKYSYDNFLKLNFINKLQEIFKFIFYDYEIKALLNSNENEVELNKKVTKEDVNKDITNTFNEVKEVAEKDIIEDLKVNYEKMLNERRNADIFKKGDYAYHLIKELDSNSGAVDINGKILEVTSRDTKTMKKMYTCLLKDNSSAIYVRFISNNRDLGIEVLTNLQVNKNIRVKGKVGIDNHNSSLFVMAHTFDLLPDDELRKDDAPQKRVELHLHTNMSEMDGISSIDEYAKLAKHMGHKALAVTDHGVVQSFPAAQQAAKKYGIKILYGCELYVIEDKLKACLNPNDSKLKDVDIVCFDLETTGLSIRYDAITEIGAVKIRNGFVTDRFDSFVNPLMPIPEKIQKKTNITNEMVKDAPTPKEIIPKFLDFIKGCVLVSHNIEFDYNFLNETMEKNGFGSLTCPGIDTVALSRYFFPDAAYHSLKYLSKRLEVSYDETSAHRADYDAEVLGLCFLSLRAKFFNNNPDIKVRDIEYLDITNEMLKKRSFRSVHYTVYAKNKAGLKDLYKIISESHTEHMGFLPFTPKSTLNKYRKNLLVGSACFNGEVFYSSYRKNLKSLQKAIDFCDFIEIQPLDCYSFLVNTEEIPSLEQVKLYLLDIINMAKKENKLICATGDVHYAKPEEKVYRDIYIANDSVGKGQHPLMTRDRANHILPFFENPNQHFLSTEEMLNAFSWLNNDEDIYNIVIKNTNLIADMCEEIKPIPDGLFPPSIDNCENMLKDIVYDTAHKLYGDKLPELIENRLKEELNGIIGNGYSVIYYIAHRLVKKANEDGYIVGSRGSVGSSLVATMAGITEVNPLIPHYRCPKCKHVEFYEDHDITSGFDLPEKNCPICGEKMVADGQSIPFQTFLGFNAEKVPDIDLNFPTDYQARAHDYTKVLLGEKNVYRAGTISAVQFKTAYGYVKHYFETFLQVDPNTISSAETAALAYGCVEVKRTTGQHPGGIVVIPRNYEVEDFTPVQYPAGDDTASRKTTHFDFHSIHDTILKLDMLGHVDPQALKMMGDLTHIDIKTIPFNDKKVLSLFSSDEALNLKHKYLPVDNGALGLPEFGTQFVRQMLRETNPHTFRDLLIISGLSHGTDVWNNNAQNLINQGITDLRGVIGCRDDIMTYLQQKGLKPSEAFKIMEQVRKGKKLNPQDIEDMKANNVPDYYIDSCNKIKYLFPKGHACAYVMMAIRVGYFKIYYPLEYYATFFTLRCDQYDIETMIKEIDAVNDKLLEFKTKRSSGLALSTKEEGIEATLQVCLELYERGFSIQNINLEKSEASNFVVDHKANSLIPPFKVLDGLGDNVANKIIEARKERPFISKEDLQARGKIASTQVKLLDKLGVLKGLDDTSQMSLFNFEF